jgi:hypothetical protein
MVGVWVWVFFFGGKVWFVWLGVAWLSLLSKKAKRVCWWCVVWGKKKRLAFFFSFYLMSRMFVLGFSEDQLGKEKKKRTMAPTTWGIDP